LQHDNFSREPGAANNPPGDFMTAAARISQAKPYSPETLAER
jgi:hypothetical protein